MADEELLYFNGINGATGDYETPPLPIEALSKIAQGEELDEKIKATLNRRHQQDTEAVHGLSEGLDPKDLASAGWGVIFAFEDKDQTPRVREALSQLLEHRKAQAGEYYREFAEGNGYRPKEYANDFLARLGASIAERVDPRQTRVPYYLLIVGDPEKIPYRFQSQLDLQYAVGRIHFDNLEDYAAYARAVVTAETQPAFLPRKATFFGVANAGDKATNLSAENLVKPLSTRVRGAQPDWEVEVLSPQDSTKARLGQLISAGTDRPSLLFSASHGMGFPLGHELQLRHQGALLCQDWPGPAFRQPIPPDFYFSADDIAASDNLLGLFAFLFACYGAGTPKTDEFAQRTSDSRQRAQIAQAAFLARLPLKMLSRGALAVIGHVERAWGTSFMWGRAGVQIGAFENAFKRLMDGHPIGSAFEFFNERYAALGSELSLLLEDARYDVVDNQKLVDSWTANNDARGYTILGDPAARLPVVAAGGAPAERPSLGVVSLPQARPAEPAPAPSFTPAAPVPPSAPETGSGAELTDYGIKESFDEVRTKVQDLVGKLVDTLKQVVDDVTSLEVRTYVSDDLSAVKYDAARREFSDAQLRAMTRISLDGDVLNCVPESGGEVDQALWQIHLSMVEQAQNSRARMLETAVSLLSSLKSL